MASSIPTSTRRNKVTINMAQDIDASLNNSDNDSIISDGTDKSFSHIERAVLSELDSALDDNTSLSDVSSFGGSSISANTYTSSYIRDVRQQNSVYSEVADNADNSMKKQLQTQANKVACDVLQKLHLTCISDMDADDINQKYFKGALGNSKTTITAMSSEIEKSLRSEIYLLLSASIHEPKPNEGVVETATAELQQQIDSISSDAPDKILTLFPVSSSKLREMQECCKPHGLRDHIKEKIEREEIRKIKLEIEAVSSRIDQMILGQKKEFEFLKSHYPADTDWSELNSKFSEELSSVEQQLRNKVDLLNVSCITPTNTVTNTFNKHTNTARAGGNNTERTGGRWRRRNNTMTPHDSLVEYMKHDESELVRAATNSAQESVRSLRLNIQLLESEAPRRIHNVMYPLRKELMQKHPFPKEASCTNVNLKDVHKYGTEEAPYGALINHPTGIRTVCTNKLEGGKKFLDECTVESMIRSVEKPPSTDKTQTKGKKLLGIFRKGGKEAKDKPLKALSLPKHVPPPPPGPTLCQLLTNINDLQELLTDIMQSEETENDWNRILENNNEKVESFLDQMVLKKIYGKELANIPVDILTDFRDTSVYQGLYKQCKTQFQYYSDNVFAPRVAISRECYKKNKEDIDEYYNDVLETAEEQMKCCDTDEKIRQFDRKIMQPAIKNASKYCKTCDKRNLKVANELFSGISNRPERIQKKKLNRSMTDVISDKTETKALWGYTKHQGTIDMGPMGSMDVTIEFEPVSKKDCSHDTKDSTTFSIHSLQTVESDEPYNNIGGVLVPVKKVSTEAHKMPLTCRHRQRSTKQRDVDQSKYNNEQPLLNCWSVQLKCDDEEIPGGKLIRTGEMSGIGNGHNREDMQVAVIEASLRVVMPEIERMALNDDNVNDVGTAEVQVVLLNTNLMTGTIGEEKKLCRVQADNCSFERMASGIVSTADDDDNLELPDYNTTVRRASIADSDRSSITDSNSTSSNNDIPATNNVRLVEVKVHSTHCNVGVNAPAAAGKKMKMNKSSHTSTANMLIENLTAAGMELSNDEKKGITRQVQDAMGRNSGRCDAIELNSQLGNNVLKISLRGKNILVVPIFNCKSGKDRTSRAVEGSLLQTTCEQFTMKNKDKIEQSASWISPPKGKVTQPPRNVLETRNDSSPPPPTPADKNQRPQILVIEDEDTLNKFKNGTLNTRLTYDFVQYRPPGQPEENYQLMHNPWYHTSGPCGKHMQDKILSHIKPHSKQIQKSNTSISGSKIFSVSGKAGRLLMPTLFGNYPSEFARSSDGGISAMVSS